MRSSVFFRLGGFPAGALGLRFDGGFCEAEEGFAGVAFWDFGLEGALAGETGASAGACP